jgi:hypothetical protein
LGEGSVEALLVLLLGVGLLMFLSGVTGKEASVAGHKVVGGVGSAPLRWFLGVGGFCLASGAVLLGVIYLVDRDKSVGAGATPSTAAANQPGTAPPTAETHSSRPSGSATGGQSDIDPLDCLGKPRDVSLDPASGPAGAWTRVRSRGYLQGEKVRVATGPGSTWEAIADRNGATSVRVRIPPELPVDSVIVYVRGVKSRCGGDALFAIE